MTFGSKINLIINLNDYTFFIYKKYMLIMIFIDISVKMKSGYWIL